MQEGNTDESRNDDRSGNFVVGDPGGGRISVLDGRRSGV